MTRCCAALEALDDDHAAGAARTTIDRRLLDIGGVGSGALILRSGEQVAGAGNIVGTSRFGEQAVVADAVEAGWQHMDEEAADELVDCERHYHGLACIITDAWDTGFSPVILAALLLATVPCLADA